MNVASYDELFSHLGHKLTVKEVKNTVCVLCNTCLEILWEFEKPTKYKAPGIYFEEITIKKKKYP